MPVSILRPCAGAWQAFLFINRHFPTLETFTAWLNTQPRPAWGVVGSTYHNTYIPNESQWRGAASMRSMQKGYEAKGWDRGPHVFLAAGTAHDGIWVMSPPTEPGIHAGGCNPKRFGLEVVGNFNTRPMSPAQLDLLVGVSAALHAWVFLGSDINAHRDCMAGRTCPGDAAYGQKAEIQRRLIVALSSVSYTPDSPILHAPGAPLSALRFPPAPRGGYKQAAISEILQAYYRISLSVALDPVLAIAQMCHETDALASWWAQRPRRNPAGIGVNGQTKPGSFPQPEPASHWHWDGDEWRFGVAFARWDADAVAAHVGRLLAYALPEGAGTPEQKTLIAYALSVRLLPTPYRGVAPTLQGLEGTWATPGLWYSEKLADWGNRLVG